VDAGALVALARVSVCRSRFLSLWSAAAEDGLEFVWSWAFWLRLRRLFLAAHLLRSLSRSFSSLSGAGRCGAGFGAGFGLSLMMRFRV
jgi:hypothetical protein